MGDEQERNSLQMSGINLMNKTLNIQNALISFCIWDVKGKIKLPLFLDSFFLYGF